LPDLFARCRAFIFPGEEDFGIAPVQAMASGRPVIAFAAGGALDTVTQESGLLFAEQSVADIIRAVESFDDEKVDPKLIRTQAEKFDTSVFASQLREFIESALDDKIVN
jgi:glycosyltransferase involved in cell wall biosynthesis